jgi:hypothetical protein
MIGQGSPVSYFQLFEDFVTNQIYILTPNPNYGESASVFSINKDYAI